jgi:glycosyltransferase involved in cell wall biosynthesis
VKQSSALSVDVRWLEGRHAIARWGREVVSRLPHRYDPLRTDIAPASAGDPVWLGRAVREYDVHLSPGYNAGLRLSRRSARQLVVLRDLMHLDVPDQSTRAKRVYYQRVVLPAVRQAGAVVTLSEFSRRRIAAWSGLPEERIVVAPGAVSPTLLTADPATDSGRDRPYVLFVGNGKPHKRAGAAVEAVLGDPDARHDLVVVGTLDGVDGSVEDLIDHTPHRLTEMARPEDDDLAALYRGADCLVLPSSYEGFPLAALEALHLGVPVVYASEAVGDIVGDLGVHVPVAEGVVGLRAAIGVAMHLRQRPGWQDDCRRRADLFSWDHAARTVAEAVDALL